MLVDRADRISASYQHAAHARSAIDEGAKPYCCDLVGVVPMVMARRAAGHSQIGRRHRQPQGGGRA
jgi:hypothetical protein